MEYIDIHLIDETINSSSSSSDRIDLKAKQTEQSAVNVTIIVPAVDTTVTNEMNVIGEEKVVKGTVRHESVNGMSDVKHHRTSALHDKVKEQDETMTHRHVSSDSTTATVQFILIDRINGTERKMNNLNVSFHMRTHVRDGFIFIFTGKLYRILSFNESKQREHSESLTNYFAVSMRRGQLVVEIKAGKKTTLIAGGDNLSDDEWHTVAMSKVDNTFTLQIDALHAMSLEIDIKSNQKLFFTPSVLIGGTFDTLHANHVIDSIFNHKKWITHKTSIQEIMRYKFTGCLQHFTVNDVPLDIHTVAPFTRGCR